MLRLLIFKTLTMTPLYPTAYYMAAFMVYKPICFQSGIALLCSLVVFPQSVSSQFRDRFSAVLDPLSKGIGQIEDLFSEASTMSSFANQASNGHTNPDGTYTFDTAVDGEAKVQAWGDRSDEVRATLLGSLKGMAPLQAQQRYLEVDISYGRLSGPDLKEIFNILASVQVRASGLSFFFNALVRKIRRTHMDSAGFSVHHTVSMMSLQNEGNNLSRPSTRTSRPTSRQASATNMQDFARRDSASASHRAETPATPGTPATPATPATSDDEVGDRHERAEKHGHDRAEKHGHDRGRLARRLLHLSTGHSREHSKERSPSREGRKSKEHHRHGSKGASHVSLLDRLHKSQQPVGVYESQRYMDLERGDER